MKKIYISLLCVLLISNGCSTKNIRNNIRESYDAKNNVTDISNFDDIQKNDNITRDNIIKMVNKIQNVNDTSVNISCDNVVVSIGISQHLTEDEIIELKDLIESNIKQTYTDLDSISVVIKHQENGLSNTEEPPNYNNNLENFVRKFTPSI